MGYKIIVSTSLFFIIVLNAFSQRYSCNYNNLDIVSKSSQACVYNQSFNYSNTDTIAKQLIVKILSLVSLPANFAIEPCDGINTCRAFVWDNGVRYIFYDRDFINKLVESNKNDWALLSILSHEIAHHLCGHTLLMSADLAVKRKSEMQADEFSGAMLARMGASKLQALLSLNSVSHPNCDSEIYNSYPCYESRKLAVLRGYNTITPDNIDPNFVASKDLDKFDISGIKSPVRNQGNDATAVGFSIAYAIEYEVYSKYKYNTQISPRYIYNGIGGTQHSGAYIEAALGFVRKKGAIEESVWPYKSGDYNNSVKSIIADTTSNRFKADYFKISTVNVDSFKKILNKGKAIIVGVKVYDYFLNDYSGKWFLKESGNNTLTGLTSLCIVGYDDNSSQFKFKNSWGTEWGDNGYGYFLFKDIEKLVESAYYIELN